MDTKTVETVFIESARLIERCGAQYAEDLLAAGRDTIGCFERGGKVLICGNGGSAAEAQHFAAELVNKLCVYRRALPALSLATDTATLTSIGNDIDFDHVFARQVEALGRAGDMLWALSTSGRSPNIIKACETAKTLGMTILCFTGMPGSPLEALADRTLAVPHADTARVQEVHLCYGHQLCLHIERHYLEQANAR
ncbi:MAG: SIS domain-containing protein [Deltaproteobacteria bacterium]|nr:SIS domain-containing protein [Deltaproteobacteria bacterium]